MGLGEGRCCRRGQNRVLSLQSIEALLIVMSTSVTFNNRAFFDSIPRDAWPSARCVQPRDRVEMVLNAPFRFQMVVRYVNWPRGRAMIWSFMEFEGSQRGRSCLRAFDAGHSS